MSLNKGLAGFMESLEIKGGSMGVWRKYDSHGGSIEVMVDPRAPMRLKKGPVGFMEYL